MAEHEDLDALWRKARPDDLASLRRLDAALVRSGYQVEGKTVREWIAALAGDRIRWFDGRDAHDRVCQAGLAAVPALMEALARADQEASWQATRNMLGQCVAALGTIDPLPTCAIPALLDVLRQPVARVRRMALAVLTRMRPRATPIALRAVLPCLKERGDAPTRQHAAQVLAAMQDPLPEEVRVAALALLGDAHRAVRREGLHVLARFPRDEEVLTALEEQAIVDDENRNEALRVLSLLAPARAIPRLLEVASSARSRRQEDGPPPPSWRGPLGETRRLEDGKRALLFIARLGVRGAEALASLDTLRSVEVLAPYVDAVMDDITRAVLRQQAPPLRTDRFQEPLCAALLTDVAWPVERTEEPSLALRPWLEPLAAFGTEVEVRVALAAARRVLWLWESQDPNNDWSRRAVMAMDRWLCEPSEEHAAQVAEVGNFTPSQFCAPDAFSAAWAVNYACGCVPRPAAPVAPRRTEEDPLGACVHAACRALSRRSVITFALGASEESPEPLSPHESARQVHRAIVDEVLPWACGAWDPVKDTPRLRKALRADSWRIPGAS
ncbi:HEAT repeat domain-containing protein [Myxococcus sp. AB036A]|uniref:HEAT repeat domain-containing protein n=1 Tax=Myxococcus sp. AB036A TaxID=2562793 RepID=UPI0011469E20|nr:HEAT repeat domain-containing protein [Myxococcus sp. AB036A]